MEITPRYSPTIELGQILQAITVALVIGGAVVPAYVSLRTDQTKNDIELRGDQAKTDAQLASLVSALAAAEAAISLRQTADEHRLDLSDQTNARYEEDQSAALSKVLDAIGDLKAAVAAERRR